MIARLRGTVADVQSDSIILDVGGVGYEVRMPSAELSRIHSGHELTVYTHLAVSQDGVALYGFSTQSEKDIFMRLQKVSSIGPHAALSLISTCGDDGLRTAIANSDVTALTRAKGVGAKGAKKIIVELSGVIAQDAHATEEDHQAVPPRMNQVIEGLCSLGFAADESRQAVAQAMQAHSFEDDIPEASMSTVLRESLARLGRN